MGLAWFVVQSLVFNSGGSSGIVVWLTTQMVTMEMTEKLVTTVTTAMLSNGSANLFISPKLLS